MEIFFEEVYDKKNLVKSKQNNSEEEQMFNAACFREILKKKNS